MAIDFTSPTKTGNYDTGILGVLRSNLMSVASMMDGVSITAGNFAGLKRYNASAALFEKSDGTAWTEMPLAYLKLAGGQTITGTVALTATATDPSHLISKGYVDAGLAAKIGAGALTPYARLDGSTFSGSVGVQGNLSVGGSTGLNGVSTTSLSVNRNAANGLGVYGSTSDTIGININNSQPGVAGNWSFGVSGSAGVSPAGSLFFYDNNRGLAGYMSHDGTFQWNGSLATAGAIAGGDITASRGDGTGVIFLGGGAHYLYFDGGRYNLVSAGLTVGGLVYGRGGGAGLGQITVQQGGGPSGGADGDLFLIY